LEKEAKQADKNQKEAERVNNAIQIEDDGGSEHTVTTETE